MVADIGGSLSEFRASTVGARAGGLIDSGLSGQASARNPNASGSTHTPHLQVRVHHVAQTFKNFIKI